MPRSAIFTSHAALSAFHAAESRMALEEELPQGVRLQCGEAEQPSGEVPVEVHLLDDDRYRPLLEERPATASRYDLDLGMKTKSEDNEPD